MRILNATTTLLVLLFSSLVAAWTAQDHEIFRLKDELELQEGPGVTFYGNFFDSDLSNAIDYLGIKPTATQDEITLAFRKKSKRMHPDKAKNDFLAARRKSQAGKKNAKPPTKAEIKEASKLAHDRYSRLGVIARLLKNEQRERYDHFLKNGFPVWKGFGYAYNRYRPGLGTVLLALFILGGGGAHYGTLTLSHKRHKEFVEKFVKDARKQAWGDSIGVRGIPTVEAPAAPGQDGFFEEAEMPMNRKQRRLQEKNSKKGSAPVTPSRAEPSRPAPVVERRKVTMENGRVLMVDSLGNVSLVEEDEDGNVAEHPLDLNDIKPPTIYDTVLFRFPTWVYAQTVGKALGSKKVEAVEEDETEGLSATEQNGNGHANGVKRRTKTARNR